MSAGITFIPPAIPPVTASPLTTDRYTTRLLSLWDVIVNNMDM